VEIASPSFDFAKNASLRMARNDGLKTKTRLVHHEDDGVPSRYHLNSSLVSWFDSSVVLSSNEPPNYQTIELTTHSVADVFISLRYNGAHPCPVYFPMDFFGK